MPMTEPRYREAVLIGWSILWRLVGGFLVLLLLMNLTILALLPELTRTGPSLLALLVPIAAATVLAALVVMPVVVRRMIGKSFSGFRLDFVRDDGTHSGFHRPNS